MIARLFVVDAIRLVGVLGLAVMLASGAGCASMAQDGSAGPAEREQLCTHLLRDMRLYCKEGLRAEHGATSMECLSRRLEFERGCF